MNALLKASVAVACLAFPQWLLAGDEANIVRGGRLYDNWSNELKLTAPGKPHPLVTARRNLPPGETWRCATCHGWDYRGNEGFPGIRQQQGKDPATLVARLKDANHRYGELLGEAELRDLALFVSAGQHDLAALEDRAERRRSNAASLSGTYATLCGNCHGLDGQMLRDIAPLGDSARQRPRELLHVMLNGHPGHSMPALRELGEDFVAGMLAYVQTLPGRNLAAAIAHGGQLYDDWQADSGTRRSALPHPAYPASGYYASDAAQTWRCKECHGWDYLGRDGAYARGRHATGIKGIRAASGQEPSKIAELLRDANHRYDAVLKPRDLEDLALFVSHGQIDMNASIDRASGHAKGDAQRGMPYFRTICGNCHGLDGQRIITTPPLGRVARESPWESLHKILNGHPGERMPALRELGLPLAVDLLSHLQQLPAERP